MRQSHLFISNAAVIWATRILLVLPQLFLVPYLIRTIGEAGYGVYALVWSLVMAFEQLQRSLQSGVVKYCAGFFAQGRLDEINSVVSSSFVYSLILAVLACAGTILAATFHYDATGQIGSALAVVGIMALFVFPLTPFVAVIQSRQRYYVEAIAETASRYVGLLVLVTWFHILGPSIIALITIMAGMLFLSRLAQVPIAYRMAPGLQNRFRLVDGDSLRLITTFGAATVFASLCLAANSTGVRWLMDALVSTTFVAHLAIILMPGLFLSQIIEAMTITVMAATSAYVATGNERMLKELLIGGMRYTTMLALASLLSAGLLMPSVLSVWLGTDYVFLSPYALVLFASLAFLLSTSIAHHMLKGIGKLRAVVFIYAVALVIVPLGVILSVLHFGNDPYVAVTAGLASGHLVCGCLQLGFCMKAVSAHMREVLARVYAPPILVAAAASLVAFGLVAAFEIDGLFGRASVCALAFALFASGCYTLVATAAERQNVRVLVPLALSKLAAIGGIPSKPARR